MKKENETLKEKMSDTSSKGKEKVAKKVDQVKNKTKKGKA